MTVHLICLIWNPGALTRQSGYLAFEREFVEKKVQPIENLSNPRRPFKDIGLEPAALADPRGSSMRMRFVYLVGLGKYVTGLRRTTIPGANRGDTPDPIFGLRVDERPRNRPGTLAIYDHKRGFLENGWVGCESHHAGVPDRRLIYKNATQEDYHCSHHIPGQNGECTEAEEEGERSTGIRRININ